MEQEIKDVIISMIYKDSYETEISLLDKKYLNENVKDIVISFLEDIYTSETNMYPRTRAYNMLLSINSLDKVQFLLDMFARMPEKLHAAYCYSLAEYDDPRAITKLCQILHENPNPNLRYIAAMSLAKFNHPMVIQALEFARDHDTAENFETIRIDQTAQWALDIIHNRAKGLDKPSAASDAEYYYDQKGNLVPLPKS